MFPYSYFEYYLLFSASYPILSIFLVESKRKEIEENTKEIQGPIKGIEVFNYIQKVEQPIYIGNQHMQTPIGGGEITLTETFLTSGAINNRHFGMCKNMRLADLEIYTDIEKLYTREKIEEFEKIFQIPINSMPPITVKHYTFEQVYFHKHILGSSHANVVKTVIKNTHLPGYIAIPSLATCVFLVSYMRERKSIF